MLELEMIQKMSENRLHKGEGVKEKGNRRNRKE